MKRRLAARSGKSIPLRMEWAWRPVVWDLCLSLIRAGWAGGVPAPAWSRGGFACRHSDVSPSAAYLAPVFAMGWFNQGLAARYGATEPSEFDF